MATELESQEKKVIRVKKDRSKALIIISIIVGLIIAISIPVSLIIYSLSDEPPSEATLESDYVYIPEITITTLDNYYETNISRKIIEVTGSFRYDNRTYVVSLGNLPLARIKKLNYYEGKVIDGYMNKNDYEDVWSDVRKHRYEFLKNSMYAKMMLFGAFAVVGVVIFVVMSKRKKV